jgi:hypothetical protein
LSRPTFILVHDAFHTSAHLEQLANALRAAEHRVLTPDIRSMDYPRDSEDFQDDASNLITFATPEIEAGLDVILILCGLSATFGITAANSLNEHSLEMPGAGEVLKLVMIAGVILDAGESYESAVRPHWIHEEVYQVVRIARGEC